MKLLKRLSLYLLITIFIWNISYSYCYASEEVLISSLVIEQNISQNVCKQGENVLLSVYLKNKFDNTSLSINKISFEFEYDMGLFPIIEISGNSMSLEKSDFDNGVFVLSNSNGKIISNGDLLFQIKLNVEDASAIGKTTICVTNIDLLEISGKTINIQNFTPVTIEIQENSELESNSDEEENLEVDSENVEEEISDLNNEDVKEENLDKNTTGTKEENDEISSEEVEDSLNETVPPEDIKDNLNKTESSEDIKGNLNKTESSENIKNNLNETASESLKKPNKNNVEKVSNSKNHIVKEKTLDENYKTGAGIGSDIYFLIAGGFGILSVIAFLLYKKILSKLKF